MRFKFISPLEKVRLTDKVNYFADYKKASALLGDRLYFAAVYDTVGDTLVRGICTEIGIDSPLAPYLEVYAVDQVPVRLPHYPDATDADYVGHEPGLYPDLLRPTRIIHPCTGCCGQLYFELNVPKTLDAGVYGITVTLTPNDGEPISDRIEIEVLPALMPEQPIEYAHWFHYDCLSTYYKAEIFSERHWELVENFVKGAVKLGVTALLTPVFTPPLDTVVGGERPTVQLVDITIENGKYSFGFEKLKRFCEMSLRCGVRQLEIAHLFTQWGAEHAPKIMATVDGKYRSIFGWETDATSAEYIGFLQEFIPAVKEKLDEYGYRDRYFFHISDEPGTKHLESYKAAKEAVWPLICDHPVRDALSHYDFYEQGIVSHPIPIVKTADQFVKNNVPDLWVYTCCSPGSVCTNRFVAMTGNRTRVVGAQMFKAGVTGFLHWGYNFYYCQHSVMPIDPFVMPDADYFAPAGDAFSVYPGNDGMPLYSLHAVLFEQALYDMRAMAAAEKVAGREAVVDAIDRAGATDFLHYSTDPQRLLALREKVNHLAAGLC